MDTFEFLIRETGPCVNQVYLWTGDVMSLTSFWRRVSRKQMLKG